MLIAHGLRWHSCFSAPKPAPRDNFAHLFSHFSYTIAPHWHAPAPVCRVLLVCARTISIISGGGRAHAHMRDYTHMHTYAALSRPIVCTRRVV